MSQIVFTGGGTAGHVIPNFPLIALAQGDGFKVAYLGSKDSIEEKLINQRQLPFYTIHSGKFRRYFSLKTLLEPFKILAGIGQACGHLRRLKAKLVFSKGGFVAFPVVVAAWLNRIPVILHESDYTPGLANRLSFPFVDKVCVNFESTRLLFKKREKVSVTGTPIRTELFLGLKDQGLKTCQFKDDKPCILVMGGSLGAASLNAAIREALPQLNKQYRVIHLCGKGKVETSLLNNENYIQFEYADEDMANFYAASSLVISRSGANSLFEILALKKPHILVPLSKKVSRGDQIDNARYFEKKGVSVVINEENLSAQSLLESIDILNQNYDSISSNLSKLDIESAAANIFQLMKAVLALKS